MATFKRRKNNKKQDLTLLRHEALEHYLMNKYNYNYREAHVIVERKYNFFIIMRNRVVQLLIMKKLKEDNQVIVYEYIPQDKIENGKGKITVNKLDSKVIDYNLSKTEIEKNILDYRNKAFFAIRTFIENKEFPENHLVAWY